MFNCSSFFAGLFTLCRLCSSVSKSYCLPICAWKTCRATGCVRRGLWCSGECHLGIYDLSGYLDISQLALWILKIVLILYRLNKVSSSRDFIFPFQGANAPTIDLYVITSSSGFRISHLKLISSDNKISNTTYTGHKEIMKHDHVIEIHSIVYGELTRFTPWMHSATESLLYNHSPSYVC